MATVEGVMNAWDALAEHVQEFGRVEAGEGDNLRATLLDSAGQVFYTNGEPDMRFISRLNGPGQLDLRVTDKHVYMRIAELLDGDGSLVEEEVLVPVP